MSRGVRSLTSREVLRVLTVFGFEVVATRGSHAKLRRILPGGERQVLTVPLHRHLAPGTLRAIVRQATRYIPEGELRPLFFKD
ncbi:MAG: type II toxin-antitoxin system HicA family toxin [bacterium]